MSNKIVSSGASGSSNLQSNDSTRIMSFTGDEDIEATIQCGRKLTIQSSQIMNVAGLVINVITEHSVEHNHE